MIREAGYSMQYAASECQAVSMQCVWMCVACFFVLPLKSRCLSPHLQAGIPQQFLKILPTAELR